MRALSWSRGTRMVMATVALAAAACVHSGQLAANVAVQVNLVTSSGTCGAQGGSGDVGVSCKTSAGPLLPAPGSVPYQRVGTIPAATRLAAQPLPVYSDGVKIASWRIVQLDNVEYLELTVAW